LLEELLPRFVTGGVVVSLFAIIGDLVRPKSLAGIFGAAPAVALASLGMAFGSHGGSYAATEGRSMVAGAVALGTYSLLIASVLFRHAGDTLFLTATAVMAWIVVALGIWWLVLR
jgi:Protein of unknown function (DUF3147)